MNYDQGMRPPAPQPVIATQPDDWSVRPSMDAAAPSRDDEPGAARVPALYVPACGVLTDLFWWAHGCRVQRAEE